MRSRRVRRLGQAGTTLPEIVVTIGVIGLVTGLSVTGITGGYDNLNAATNTVLNELRLTRLNSMTRGAHHRMVFGTDSLQRQRLQDADGNGEWDEDSQFEADDIALPDDIALSVEGSVTATGGLSVEFDSRGMLVVPSGAANSVIEVSVVAVSGMNAGKVNQVEVWPSGQIQIAD